MADWNCFGYAGIHIFGLTIRSFKHRLSCLFAVDSRVKHLALWIYRLPVKEDELPESSDCHRAMTKEQHEMRPRSPSFWVKGPKPFQRRVFPSGQGSCDHGLWRPLELPTLSSCAVRVRFGPDASARSAPGRKHRSCTGTSWINLQVDLQDRHGRCRIRSVKKDTFGRRILPVLVNTACRQCWASEGCYPYIFTTYLSLNVAEASEL